MRPLEHGGTAMGTRTCAWQIPTVPHRANQRALHAPGRTAWRCAIRRRAHEAAT